MLLATSDKKYFNTDYSCLPIAKFNAIQVLILRVFLAACERTATAYPKRHFLSKKEKLFLRMARQWNDGES